MRWDYYGRMALNYVREPERLLEEHESWKRRRQAAKAPLVPLPTNAAADLPVVVSLTSYGTRISRVHLAIRSIMDQTVRPNRVELWLGEDSDDIPIPPELAELTDCGLTIHRGVEDLKGHKKYYFSMREEEEVLLVTIDDDLVYTKDTIASLLAAHQVLPQAVVARRCHRMRFAEGSIAPYDTWEMNFQAGHPLASRLPRPPTRDPCPMSCPRPSQPASSSRTSTTVETTPSLPASWTTSASPQGTSKTPSQ